MTVVKFLVKNAMVSDKVAGEAERCTRSGERQEGKRALRPVSYCSAMDMLKSAGLACIEIVVVVLYTGPMLILY